MSDNGKAVRGRLYGDLLIPPSKPGANDDDVMAFNNSPYFVMHDGPESHAARVEAVAIVLYQELTSEDPFVTDDDALLLARTKAPKVLAALGLAPVATEGA